MLIIKLLFNNVNLTKELFNYTHTNQSFIHSYILTTAIINGSNKKKNFKKVSFLNSFLRENKSLEVDEICKTEQIISKIQKKK